MNETHLPRTLTIAGSDSGGGAGIQADLKTFSALGCYGMTAITSVTVQNTTGVFGVHDLPHEMVGNQIDVVAEDIGVDAVKTGMLSSSAIIETVAASIRRHGIERLVVDPVMVAKSGDALLHESARETLIRELLPLALVVTPNVPEAEAISGVPITDEDHLAEAAEKIHAMGPRYVLMKGGHLDTSHATDYLYADELVKVYPGRRLATHNTHGTGCTFSAAIAAYLAWGEDVSEAVRLAKRYVSRAIATSLPLGQGHGPLNHLWNITPPR